MDVRGFTSVCSRLRGLTTLGLQVKSLELGEPKEFLSKAMQPPEAAAVDAALDTLTEIAAIDGDGILTPLGVHLSTLPVDARIGKMILYGALFQCLDPILTIAATMSFKSPFLSPLEKREEANEHKALFTVGRSDHLTSLNAYNQWHAQKHKRGGAEWQFSREHFLSGQTLKMIQELKGQLTELLCDIDFVWNTDGKTGRSFYSSEPSGGDLFNANSCNLKLIKGVLVAGLYPRVASVTPNPDPKKPPNVKTRRDGPVMIHPSSVNFDRMSFESPWLVYHEKVKTSAIFLRDSSMVSPYSLILFGGRIFLEEKKNMLKVDNWIKFKMEAGESHVIKAFRLALDRLLLYKIENPGFDASEAATGTITGIIELIDSERHPDLEHINWVPVQPPGAGRRTSLEANSAQGAPGEDVTVMIPAPNSKNSKSNSGNTASKAVPAPKPATPKAPKPAPTSVPAPKDAAKGSKKSVPREAALPAPKATVPAPRPAAAESPAPPSVNKTDAEEPKKSKKAAKSKDTKESAVNFEMASAEGWTVKQEKRLIAALEKYPASDDERLDKVVADVGKTRKQIIKRCKELSDDLKSRLELE